MIDEQTIENLYQQKTDSNPLTNVTQLYHEYNFNYIMSTRFTIHNIQKASVGLVAIQCLIGFGSHAKTMRRGKNIAA
jgi:hypothetical protein